MLITYRLFKGDLSNDDGSSIMAVLTLEEYRDLLALIKECRKTRSVLHRLIAEFRYLKNREKRIRETKQYLNEYKY